MFLLLLQNMQITVSIVFCEDENSMIIPFVFSSSNSK